MKTTIYKILLIGLMLFTHGLANESSLDIIDGEKSSFSPARGDTMPITIKGKNLSSIQMTIYTSDGDAIRTIEHDVVTDAEDGETHSLLWDGKDKNGMIVPDEAYHPVITGVFKNNKTLVLDSRKNSGGEEVFKFSKNPSATSVDYELPVDSRVLIRTGIKNGPMLRSIVDWEPRVAGYHAERWNGKDQDGVVSIGEHPQISYLIIGYQLPNHTVITYGNEEISYRAYREKNKWGLKPVDYSQHALERNGKKIMPEFYHAILQQKSPRISVDMVSVLDSEPVTTVTGFDEVVTMINIHTDDEIYLDQERYEVSFFVDNDFIAEEEQGFVPYQWTWSPARLGIEPGDHVLTVNISGYNGQVGVKNIPFTVKAAAQGE